MILFRAPRRLALGLVFAQALAVAAVAATEHSQLWGERGEKWTAAESRLPDFSHAGYRRGEVPLPHPPQATNVRDFGAVGDGAADDTKAFQAAIAATTRGAVFVPPGRYKIGDHLRIAKSGVVLRGAGPDKSVLWFPRGLDEVHPKNGRTSTGSPASGYSFDGAFVTVEGDYRAKPLARIVAAARRGDTELHVDRADRVTVGQNILVVVRETPDHSLKTWLHGGDPGDISQGKMLDTKMLARVVAVDGDRVRIDRPLRFETRAAWQPEIRDFAPTVTESGIEALGFEFPAAPYRGHFKETGHNAIELDAVFNCWVRDVAIHNGDLAVNVLGCGNTIDGVVTTADPARVLMARGVALTGHHAIQCKRAEDNLVTNFDLRASYVHDLSVEHASGNVFARGRGADLNFDHHKDTPYENLHTDIDCGRGGRVWQSGGGAGLGRQTAGWATFWNIRAAQPLAPPPKGWGVASMNVVGLATKHANTLEPGGVWLEAIAPEQLEPRNLHAAQLARRLAATARPAPAPAAHGK